MPSRYSSYGMWCTNRLATLSRFWRSFTLWWRFCLGSSEVGDPMDTFVTVVIAVSVAIFFLRRYLSNLKQNDELARHIAERGKLYSEEPKGLHPHIDATYCIGCATCAAVCPEGDVLAML